MHRRDRCAVGEEEAAALMELVPKAAWSDIATKRDVAELATRLDHMDALWRAEFGRLEASMEVTIADAVNRLTFRLLPAMATMIAVFGAIAALF